MNKTYLRYSLEDTFGVISATNCNITVDPRHQHVIAGALQDVVVWDIRKGTKVRALKTQGDQHVTAVAFNDATNAIAAGYSDGSVRLWEAITGELKSTLHGHKRAVNCIRFRNDGAQIVTGSKDTHVIVWDTIAEAGLFRLRGHRDEVTDVVFSADGKRVTSSSKDTLVKVWDLETQHATFTCVGHKGEVWSLDLSPDGGHRLVTGSVDNQLRLYDVCVDEEAENARRRRVALALKAASAAEKGDEATMDEDQEELSNPELLLATEPAKLGDLRSIGAVFRRTAERATTVAYAPGGQMLACQGAGKSVEIYKMRNEQEIKRRITRRKRRQREKANKKSGGGADGDAVDADDDDADDDDAGAMGLGQDGEQAMAVDELELYAVIESTHKIRSIAFCSATAVPAGGVFTIILGLQNNMIEVHSVRPSPTYRKNSGDPTDLPGLAVRVRQIGLAGHRSDVRASCISSDDSLLLTTSSTQAKLWNIQFRSCIRSMISGFGLCCAFGPGNRHGIVGTKKGKLQLFDLASGDLVEEHQAHEGELWSLDVRPDFKGIVTGGADHTVKFWDFEAAERRADGSSNAAQALSLVHTRTLKLSEDVLCVRYSHHTEADKLLLAVALLDSTVKVFFEDTLKFFLSLYGHKLPVMSMDISTDNSLIITGSADKNVKIWGLDFGDCHRSLFAHSDSVMGVKFVPGTHLFFSCGKDRDVKYWDGDRFDNILKMAGHGSEVWTLSVARRGQFLLTGGHDRSIRFWNKTDDIVFIEEEKQKQLEEVFDRELKEPGAEDPDDVRESGDLIRKTADTAKGVDRLMEALDLAEEEEFKWIEFEQDEAAAEAELTAAERAERAEAQRSGGAAPEPLTTWPRPSPLLLNQTPPMYVLRTLRAIRPSELETVLSTLPFKQSMQLIQYMHHLLRRNTAVELCTKIVVSITTIHRSQIVANNTAVAALQSLRDVTHARVRELRDRVGFNMAGVQFMLKAAESRSDLKPEHDEEEEAEEEDDDALYARSRKRRIEIF